MMSCSCKSKLCAAVCLSAMLCLCLTVTTALAEEEEEVTCGCEGMERGFTISCSSNATAIEAFEYLEANNCNTFCLPESECYTNYLILQSHHDHCPESFLPDAIGVEFHEFEEGCGEGCEIARQYDSALSACMVPDCSDNTPATDAIATLEANNCVTSCDSSTCMDAFQTVQAYHDVCLHDELIEEIEEAFHAYEECEGCNTHTSNFDPNVCSGASLTAPVTTFAAFAAVGVALFASSF